MSRYRIRPVSVGVLARGAAYRIKDLGATPGGYTELVKKELGVSLDADSPLTRWTQLHELSHVRHTLWTPGRIAQYIERAHGVKVDPGLILGAEDARINEILKRRVPDCMDGYELTPAYRANMRRDLTAWLACHASPPCRAVEVGPYVSAAEKRAVAPLLKMIETAPIEQLTILRATVPLVMAAHKAAQAQQGQGQPGGGQGKPGEQPGEDGADDGAEDDQEGVPTKEDERALGKPNAAQGVKCGGGAPPGTGQRQNWLIPEVFEPPLTEAHVGGSATWISAESGSVIRWSALHRLGTDGVVFRRAKRKPGAIQRGTVLIDFSGSVAFTEDDLREMVDLLPFATIAVYSGRTSTWSGTQKRGAHIVVVARNGRRRASLDFRDVVPGGLGRDNACDGPALLWLSRQPGPRLWVCDGLVTGEAGCLNTALAEECDAIVRAGSIFQLTWGKAAITWGKVAPRVTRGMVQTVFGWNREGFKAALGMLAHGLVSDPGPQSYRGM